MKIKLKNIIVGSLSVLIACSSYGQTKKPFESTDYQVEYTSNDGRITGEYASKYANGMSKANGQLINGYKYGDWKIYDSTGALVMHRLYTSPFEFTRIYPEHSEEGPVQTLAQSIYKVEKNEDGYMPYFQIHQRSVKWSKRVWRNIDLADNEELFKGDRLYRLFCDLTNDGSIKIYGVENDEFTDELEYRTEDFKDQAPIRYKIKEESFFDSDRMEMETRIIGICPVAEANGETKDLFWVYLPEARAHLAKNKVKSDFPERIKTYDDLFFLRDFASSIYMESNYSSKPIASYKQGAEIQKEAERIEMSILNKEIDILLSLSQ